MVNQVGRSFYRVDIAHRQLNEIVSSILDYSLLVVLPSFNYQLQRHQHAVHSAVLTGKCRLICSRSKAHRSHRTPERLPYAVCQSPEDLDSLVNKLIN